jgi:hypothetical protein
MDPSHADKIAVRPVGIDRDFLDYADSLLDMGAPDSRILRTRSAVAAKRRAQFANYVTAAIAVAAILCCAAVVKVAVGRGHEGAKESAGRSASAPR